MSKKHLLGYAKIKITTKGISDNSINIQHYKLSAITNNSYKGNLPEKFLYDQCTVFGVDEVSVFIKLDDKLLETLGEKYEFTNDSTNENINKLVKILGIRNESIEILGGIIDEKLFCLTSSLCTMIQYYKNNSTLDISYGYYILRYTLSIDRWDVTIDCQVYPYHKGIVNDIPK